MGAIYKWKLDDQFRVDAQVAGDALENLRIRNNGHLTPRSVVEYARPEESPLHEAFEWSDAIAGERWREAQAAQMVRSIVTVLPQQNNEARPVRAFINVKVEDESVYTSTIAALSDAAMRRQVLARAWQELRSWQTRYRDLEVLADLFSEIDRKEASLDL